MLLICHTQLLFLLVLSEFANCAYQSGLFWSKGWRVYVYVMTGSLFTVHVNSTFGISNQINLSWLIRIWPCKHSYCVFTAVLDCSLMALLFQHHGQLFFSPQSIVSAPRTAPRARLLLRRLPVPSNNSQRCYETAGEANHHPSSQAGVEGYDASLWERRTRWNNIPASYSRSILEIVLGLQNDKREACNTASLWRSELRTSTVWVISPRRQRQLMSVYYVLCVHLNPNSLENASRK